MYLNLKLGHSKTHKMKSALSEDSDQPVYLCSLIMSTLSTLWVDKDPVLQAELRLSYVPADMSLHWVHMSFCSILAQIITYISMSEIRIIMIFVLRVFCEVNISSQWCTGIYFCITTNNLQEKRTNQIYMMLRKRKKHCSILQKKHVSKF